MTISPEQGRERPRMTAALNRTFSLALREAQISHHPRPVIGHILYGLSDGPDLKAREFFETLGITPTFIHGELLKRGGITDTHVSPPGDHELLQPADLSLLSPRVKQVYRATMAGATGPITPVDYLTKILELEEGGMSLRFIIDKISILPERQKEVDEAVLKYRAKQAQGTAVTECSIEWNTAIDFVPDDKALDDFSIRLRKELKIDGNGIPDVNAVDDFNRRLREKMEYAKLVLQDIVTKPDTNPSE